MRNFLTNFFRGNGGGADKAPGRRKELVTGLDAPAGMESPYIAGRREWNERYGSYIAREQQWKVAFFLVLIFCGVLVAALVKIAGESKVEPYIVKVDKLGQEVAVGAMPKAHIPNQTIIRYQLASYITHARSITPDRVVQKRWLNSVYSDSGSAAIQFLNAYYKANNPFTAAKNVMVSVNITSALPLSKKTWQIQWTETTRDLSGRTVSSTDWQAVLNISTFQPTTAKEIIANPTGILIKHISWAQQL